MDRKAAANAVLLSLHNYAVGAFIMDDGLKRFLEICMWCTWFMWCMCAMLRMVKVHEFAASMQLVSPADGCKADKFELMYKCVN